MAVIVKAESYPMAEGRRGKLGRETSPYLGRHGTGGSMCQAEMAWAEWIIRPKVGN